MPRAKGEREAWEAELNDLPAQIESYQRELLATPVEAQDRRERLRWRIRRDEKRIAELRARLQGGDDDGRRSS